jgi:hypothetical protein
LDLGVHVALHQPQCGVAQLGVDGITKPFNLEEVLALLRVILRRTGGGVEAESRTGRLGFADIELDEDTHETWEAGEPVSPSATEFALLRYLINNRPEQEEDPRTRMALRLHRRHQRRRVLHLLPARQDRPRQWLAARVARRRLHPARTSVSGGPRRAGMMAATDQRLVRRHS